MFLANVLFVSVEIPKKLMKALQGVKETAPSLWGEGTFASFFFFTVRITPPQCLCGSMMEAI